VRKSNFGADDGGAKLEVQVAFRPLLLLHQRHLLLEDGEGSVGSTARVLWVC
jgi:hypothetical protein